MMNQRELMHWLYGWICLKNYIRSGSTYFITRMTTPDGVYPCPPDDVTREQRLIIANRFDTYRRCEMRLFGVLGQWVYENILRASECPLELLEKRVEQFCESITHPTSRDIEAFILGYLEITEDPSPCRLTVEQSVTIINLMERNVDGLCPAVIKLYNIITENLYCQNQGECPRAAVEIELGGLYDYLYKTFYGHYLPKPRIAGKPCGYGGGYGSCGPAGYGSGFCGDNKHDDFSDSSSVSHSESDVCSKKDRFSHDGRDFSHSDDNDHSGSSSKSDFDDHGSSCNFGGAFPYGGGQGTGYGHGLGYVGGVGGNSFPPGACGLGKNVGPCCAPPYRNDLLDNSCQLGPCSGGGYGGGFPDGYSYWARRPSYQRGSATFY